MALCRSDFDFRRGFICIFVLASGAGWHIVGIGGAHRPRSSVFKERASVWERMFGKQEMRILMVGLDAVSRNLDDVSLKTVFTYTLTLMLKLYVR